MLGSQGTGTPEDHKIGLASGKGCREQSRQPRAAFRGNGRSLSQITLSRVETDPPSHLAPSTHSVMNDFSFLRMDDKLGVVRKLCQGLGVPSQKINYTYCHEGGERELVRNYACLLLEVSIRNSRARALGPLRGRWLGRGWCPDTPEETNPMGVRALVPIPPPQPSLPWASSLATSSSEDRSRLRA